MQQLQSGKDYLVSDPESTVSDDYDDDDDDGDDDGDNDGAPGLLTATALDRQAGHAPDNLNVSGLKRTTQDLPTYRAARLCDPRLLPAASGDSAGQLAMQHHQRPYAGGTSHSLGQLDAGGPLGLPKPSIYRRSSGPTQHLGTSSIARGARDAGLPQRLPLRRQQPSPEVRQSQADLGQSQPESRQPRSSQTEKTVSHAQMGGSLAEAAAGLLAMTSTDKSQDQPKVNVHPSAVTTFHVKLLPIQPTFDIRLRSC